ncbi:cryptochrome/photolyase family protein [Rhodoferax aquaticus]|uniref:Deoxyribodipyrimidine photo-lyase n=1 Tax=Rhodoferax aquaticus TaxID=2527691 RepID=A0A515ESQ1_9BURK|nr:deoxyribodipyrimidine photo-lyase [Rhodoferax aquaticus]QDL55696.1 deoxyribodipyrimidine photo-lyase [Rhodoferax aquaticus]
MQAQFKTGLVWFRRDLRLHDNVALSTALAECEQVHCVFVFDTAILSALPKHDRRVEFIHGAVQELDASLRQVAGHAHAGLLVAHGDAQTLVPEIALALSANAVYCGRDYEPAALNRDAAVELALSGQGIAFRTVKDHVIFERMEVVTQVGKPYTVFTPYWRAWLARLEDTPLGPCRLDDAENMLAAKPAAWRNELPSLEALGFERTNLSALHLGAGEAAASALLADFWPRLERYDSARDFPAVKGPSYLGVHLRFGTVSIRQLVQLAYEQYLAGNQGAKVWLSELAWRDFYVQILANFPHVVGHPFKAAYNNVQWEEGPTALALFEAWCQGKTGYPLVDAAMAQINQTGYMHNRLRMVAGSFLVKHLGIDWRWGEAYFAEKLNDFDLSANNGGWQWVSSTGCDAQPYFRIFNPITQSEKFDGEGKFIRRYLPQLGQLGKRAIHAPWLAKPQELTVAKVVLGENYPHPVIDHGEARARTLARYAQARDADQPSADTTQ